MEYSDIKTEQSSEACGTKVFSTGKVTKHGQTDQNTSANITTGRKKDAEFIYGKMDLNSQANGRTM